MASSEGGKPRGRGKKTPAVAGSKRQKKARASAADTEEDLREQDGDAYLPAKMTKRILEQAREQRDEMEEEEEGGGGEGGGGTKKKSGGGGLAADQRFSFVAPASGRGGDSSDEDDGDDGSEGDSEDEEADEEEVGVDGVGMSEAEERLVASFMNAAPMQRRSLADIIMDKIREKEEGEARAAGGGGDDEDDEGMPRLPPKVVEVYGSIGKLLKTYTAGKLPKAFKIIPSITNWEQILWLTKPESWSNHAMLAATKVFASNFNDKMAQRFYNIFLLEACRSDIAENRRLNYHLYEALRKSVYKPAAFYKGMLLPLASAGDCTLREASIFASVLARVTIPANHSAVALLKLAQLPYNGASSLFIRVLLNKKYALPYKVIDTLVDHFMTFTAETRVLPVLWHQSLLVFAQRYRGDITRADKDRLKELLKVQQHHQITPEVRRQLFMGGCRGEPKGSLASTPKSTDAMAVG
eukprot:jgi/Undpi1/9312/HiC_scaffold_26.g11770.m1